MTRPLMIQMVMFVVFSLVFLSVPRLDAFINPALDGCEGEVGNFTKDSPYQYNIGVLLRDISSQATFSKLYNVTRGVLSDKVYGLFQCRQDVSLQTCSVCVQAAIDDILSQCPLYVKAIVWYFECTVKYSDGNFFSATYPFSEQLRDAKLESYGQFALAETLNEVINDTASNGFATMEANVSNSVKLYVLGQCTFDISKFNCAACLTSALDEMNKCCNARVGAMVFMPSCNLGYDTSPFYNVDVKLYPSPGSPAPAPGSPAPAPSRHRKGLSSSPARPISIGLAIGAGIIVLSVLFYLCREKANKYYRAITNKAPLEAPDGGAIAEMKTVESLQYGFSTIKAAINNFSEINKLGKGGFGDVYKGKLGDGQEIAVKRLSKYSDQGTSEFKNEVVLVAKLQHRNLVKLHGFCITGTEKLLIYEYLSNSSLDQFLDDPLKRASLDWETRFRIISGIARGLLYLHEDSRLKIIHRDLKSSNILLDHSMNAKISDFGLAKLFAVDQTQGDTRRIVGTYGYMAPEYAMTGNFSVRSDIYSYGVIVLELVCGQRNNFFNLQADEEALLLRAWRLWNEEKALNLIDPMLGDAFSNEEVKMSIHIGLLCIQDDATKRPKMASVVAALNGQSISLPLPDPPHSFTISYPSDATSSNFNSQAGNEIQYSGSHLDGSVVVHTGATNITEVIPR